MKEHGIGDEANIKEIILEVDTDNVSHLLSHLKKLMNSLICRARSYTITTIGWKDRLHRILHNDEKWDATTSKTLLVSISFC